MNDVKSTVRAALVELIEADEKGTKGRLLVSHRDRVSFLHVKTKIADVFSEAFGDTQNQRANAELFALARNLAPGMARILLKTLDDNECNKCQGYGSWKADTSERGPCPRCAVRWQEWAGWLGVDK